MKILLCETTPRINGEFEQALAESGHTVATVVTAADDIVHAVSVTQPELVFVSLKMLGQYCFEIIQRIHHVAHVPVIIKTARRTDALLRQASASGAGWVLETPADAAAIDLAIRIALLRHQDFLQLRKLRESTERAVREFLHRIKNDLAVIASLMHLQAGCSSHPETAGAILESADRVRVVAALYDIIRSSEYKDALRLDDYFELLISKLCHGTAREKGYSLEVSTEYIIADGMTSLNCGLLVNELVSNALKYASPDDEKNILIQVTVKKTAGNGSIEICVNDNGAGLPRNIEPARAATFGFQLISLLVDQLKGNMKISRSGGTEFILTFPNPQLNDVIAEK
ncbi:MAG: ATP-binding protein [Desulfobulbaceae bacterium]|nr:ATP-binding protein [Desulfobulbaceae bacterium]